MDSDHPAPTETTTPAAEYVETADLPERVEDLTEAMKAGREVPAGRLLGLADLPDGDYWVDIAGASALTGVPAATIRPWIYRGQPKANPFPTPVRVLYRLYWPASTITTWRDNRNQT